MARALVVLVHLELVQVRLALEQVAALVQVLSQEVAVQVHLAQVHPVQALACPAVVALALEPTQVQAPEPIAALVQEVAVAPELAPLDLGQEHLVQEPAHPAVVQALLAPVVVVLALVDPALLAAAVINRICFN